MKTLECNRTIVTQYLGPTNYRGSRIKAAHKLGDDPAHTVTLSYDDGMNSDENHQAAAEALCEKLSARNKYYNYKLTDCGIFGFKHFYTAKMIPLNREQIEAKQ